jgi:hypothetical protein
MHVTSKRPAERVLLHGTFAWAPRYQDRRDRDAVALHPTRWASWRRPTSDRFGPSWPIGEMAENGRGPMIDRPRLSQWAALTLACTAFACSTSGSDAPQHGESNGGSSGASSSGSGSSSSSGSTSTSGSSSSSSSSSGSSSGSGEDAGAGSDAAAGPDGGDSGVGVLGPCDIYQTGNTPCVAAHSTARALYGAYDGKLYQVTRASDMTTMDIPVLSPGGFADSAQQDAFCSSTMCSITIIYDQSPQGNHLPVSHALGGGPANASAAKITVGGHPVYGVYTAAGGTGNYRIDQTTGIATGDDPEAMYMVLDGTRFSAPCCYDYGNAETNGNDDGAGTMEAVYWGSDTFWTVCGGNGPWVKGDLENGMYCGDSKNTPGNTSVTGMSYVTAMLKGPSGNNLKLKAGNAQSGALAIKWDGARPPGYSPMKKQGAIILGTGGDSSNNGDGTFFEGCMTSGNPSDAIDDAVQANVVAAGYGQ